MNKKLTVTEAVRLNDKYKSSGLTQKAFALAEGITIYKISLCRRIIQRKKPGFTSPVTNVCFTEVKQPCIPKTLIPHRSGVSISIGEFAIDLEGAFDDKVLSKVIGVLNKELIDV